MGLIDQVKAPPVSAMPTAAQTQDQVPPPDIAAPQTPAAPAQAPAQPQFKSKVVEAVPANMREDFTKLVMAGMKILYDKSMQPDIQQALQGDKPIWQKLGEGVAKLMTILDTQSKKTVPKDLLIPAGIELVHEYGDFLQQSGQQKVTPDDIQQGSAYAAVAIAKLYGAPDQQITSMFKPPQGQVPGAPAAAPPATPPAAPPAAAPGLLQGR